MELEFYDQRRHLASKLISRVENLEKQMRNFSETLGDVRTRLVNRTGAFWLNDGPPETNLTKHIPP